MPLTEQLKYLNALSYHSGGYKSNIKVWVEWLLRARRENVLPGLSPSLWYFSGDLWHSLNCPAVHIHLHMGFSCVHAYLQISALMRTKSYWPRNLLYLNVTLSRLHLQRLDFQTSSHSKIPEVKTSTREFCGT